MTNINHETFEINITETLSFQHHVLPMIHRLQEDYADVDLEGMREFIDMKDENWTSTQKIGFLDEILYNWERESNYYEVSIFDEDIIRKGVTNYLASEFDIDIE